jgi:hypothetical protein
MSTATQKHTQLTPRNERPRTDEEIRRDRRTAIIVVAVMLAVMALLVWLASLGGDAPFQEIDYWPMMP